MRTCVSLLEGRRAGKRRPWVVSVAVSFSKHLSAVDTILNNGRETWVLCLAWSASLSGDAAKMEKERS